MNLIIVLFLVLIAASMFTGVSATKASRRRARNNYRNTRYAVSQEENLARILGSNELSLFNVDQMRSNGHYNKAMCGYMNEHMFINGSLVEYTEAVQSAFTKEYFATIYQRKYFPLTHRPAGEVWLNATENHVRRFYRLHCPIPIEYDVLLTGLVAFGFLLSCILTMISCFLCMFRYMEEQAKTKRMERERRERHRLR
jgi:hypothetical protein